MDRRTMLRALIASGLAATIDPERLLWVPKQMIAVPNRITWPVGTWLTWANGRYEKLTTTIRGPVGIWDGASVITHGLARGLVVEADADRLVGFTLDRPFIMDDRVIGAASEGAHWIRANG